MTPRRCPTTSSSISRAGSPARTAPSSSPTAAPRSSRSNRPRAIRCAAGRRRGPTIPAGDDGALFTFLSSSKQSVVADPDDPATLARVHDLLRRRRRGRVVAADRASPSTPALAPARDPRAAAPHLDRHGDHAVRPRRAVERPRRDRVHAAGVVGRDRRARPRLAGPRAGARRRPDRRVAHRRVRGDRHDRSRGPVRRGDGARRARRRVDARDAGAVPHLLPGDLSSTWSAGRSASGRAVVDARASRRRATASSASASAPASSGSTSA